MMDLNPDLTDQDEILKDYDLMYGFCEDLRTNLIENADLRLHRSHHRLDLRETLDDLDTLDKFLELFQAEMDPREDDAANNDG